MDFRAFVQILVRRWKLVVSAILTCLLGAATVTAFQTKSYEASATILISFSGQNTVQDVYQATLAAHDRLSSYATIAGGRTVAERALDQLHLPISASALVSKTHVSYAPESSLFTITVADIDPQRVAALAAAMADQFVKIAPTLDNNVGSVNLRRPDERGREPNPPTGQDAVPIAVATVVERPSVPTAAVKPVPATNLALGLVAGLVLGTGVALAREAADRSVRNRERLESLTGVPTLAELPGRNGSAPRFGTDAAYDDAVRGFRARLLRVMGPDGRRVLLVAPFGGEGTTTTALNLALTLAEIGEQTLLVEGDTRRSVIAGLMNVRSADGLADVLANPHSIGAAVRPTPVDNMSILAARAVRRDTLPCSAYLPETVDNVLAELSTRFDRMVVDGPPVLATADAGLLSRAVHATVVVVRAGSTTVDELADALTALRAAGAQIVGTVLTDARTSRHIKAADRLYRAKASGPA